MNESLHDQVSSVVWQALAKLIRTLALVGRSFHVYAISRAFSEGLTVNADRADRPFPPISAQIRVSVRKVYREIL